MNCGGGQQHNVIGIQKDAEGEGRQVGAVETGAARGMLQEIGRHAVKEEGKKAGAHGAPLFHTLAHRERRRVGGTHPDDSHRVAVK